MAPQTSSPRWQRIWPDFLAFAIGLSLAQHNGWQTADLVWSLWLSSLLVGYLTIILILSAPLYHTFKTFTKPNVSRRTSVLFAGGVTLFCLFLLAFFTFHFGMFHFVHSVFLRHFFPLNTLSAAQGPVYMQNDGPLHIVPLVWDVLLPRYGLFVLCTLIAERDVLLAPFRTPTTFSSPRPVDRLSPDIAEGVATLARNQRSIGDAMRQPYVNVIRMHVLIFFFAFSSQLKLPTTAVFTTVYCVYFFPWRSLMFWKDPTPA